MFYFIFFILVVNVDVFQIRTNSVAHGCMVDKNVLHDISVQNRIDYIFQMTLFIGGGICFVKGTCSLHCIIPNVHIMKPYIYL